MCRPDPLLAPSDIPAWKSLIDHPLTSDQRITLIADIFSDRDETEAVKHLHGDDAQSFVNIIDEVLLHRPTYPPKNGPIELTTNLFCPPSRC